MKVQVSFSDGVPEKGQNRGVSGYPFMALDDHCGPIFHGIRQLARAIVSMNLHAQALTILNVRKLARVGPSTLQSVSEAAVPALPRLARGHQSPVGYTGPSDLL